MTQSPQLPSPVYGPLPNAPGSVTSLVCGIIGVAIGCRGLVLGIVAIMQSKKAKAAVAAAPGTCSGEGMATAGLVLGIIGIVVGSIWAVCIAIWSIVAIGFATSAVGS